jgi:hypothetical protein
MTNLRAAAVRVQQADHFAPLKVFSFFSGAKFGEFRPTLSAQVVCDPPVGEWGWGEIV